jgi:peroxiredoxin
MIELGQLEKNHQAFVQRYTRIVVVSNDDQATAKLTQADFPHLLVVSDAQQNIAKAMQVIQSGAAADGTDTNAPTTILIDGRGTVRWVFRPERFLVRLSPAELLEAISGINWGK